METGNDGSVSMVFDGLGIRSVFLGDLGEDAQAALLAAGPIGRADVVKVAHHGSSDQSAELYSQLRAGVGLVSVGADNGYGHPTRSLLATLRSTGTLVERTDRNGLVVIGPAGNGQLRVWTERVWSAE
jgi:competence protein ComEC